MGKNINLEQRCPTLSPFATCGYRPFKCCDKKIFPEEILSWTSPINAFVEHISHNCGNSKGFVATKVANVATGTIGWDNAHLEQSQELNYAKVILRLIVCSKGLNLIRKNQSNRNAIRSAIFELNK